jgi:hypothetical protein
MDLAFELTYLAGDAHGRAGAFAREKRSIRMTLSRHLLSRAVKFAGLLWMQLGMLLLFIVLIDLICRLAAPLTYVEPDNGHADAIAAYPQIPWLRDYYAVYDRLSVKWHPYVYFLMSPIKSAYININDDGIRATWHPPRPASQEGIRPLRIFVFGGSTMFGDNARDDYTIASFIARSLAAGARVPVDVINFGQEGFSNTQEALLLAEQLRQGNTPDLVIFYDGINEIATAFENHAPGLTFDELSRSREFNLLNADHRPQLSRFALYNLVRYSYAGLTAEWLADRFLSQLSYDIRTRLANARFRAAGLPPTTETANAQLADGVVNTYLFNKRAIETLARRHGFHCLFFWQPVLFEKNRLSTFEKTLVENQDRDFPGYRDFFRQTYARLREVSTRDNVVDLSRVFSDTDVSYYTDEAHLIEAGNRVVVAAMLPQVQAALSNARQPEAVNLGQQSVPPSHTIR